MKSADKLFDFITRMSPHERGYFKYRAEKGSYYLLLFEAICKQKKYDEKALIALLKKHGCKRTIFTLKGYLWQELMQTMAPYHLQKTPEGKTIARLQNIYLLMAKGLTRHVTAEINAVKKECYKYELYELLLQVKFAELEVNANNVVNGGHTFWEEYYEVEKMVKRQMQLMHANDSIGRYTYSLKPQRNQMLLKIEAIMQHPALNEAATGNSPRARLTLQSILATRANIYNDMKGVIEHNMAIVELCKNNPNLTGVADTLPVVYGNLLLGLLCSKDRVYSAKLVDGIISSLKDTTLTEKQRLGNLIYGRAIRMLIYNDYKLLPQLAADFKHHQHEFTTAINFNIYDILANCFYKAGHYNTALDWINDGMAYCHKQKTDRYDILEMLHILIHFEMQQHEYARNRVHRFLRARKIAPPFTSAAYLVLWYLLRALKAKRPDAELKKMQAHLQKDFAADNTAIRFSAPQWVEAMLNREPFYLTTARYAQHEFKAGKMKLK